MGKNKTTQGTPAAALLAGGLHDFSRYEKRPPAQVTVCEPAPLPMIELDDAIAAERAADPWVHFEVEMEWADRCLARGDVLRWKTATFAAVRNLQVALGSQ